MQHELKQSVIKIDRFVMGAMIIAAGFICIPAAALVDVVLPPKIYSQTPTGINLGDGSFYQNETDLSIGPLTLQRLHVGGPVTDLQREFGITWTHNFDLYMYDKPLGPPSNSYVTSVHLFGKVYSFNGNFNTINPSPFTDDSDGTKLEQSGDVFTFTDRDGTTYNFSRSLSFKVTAITYPNGRKTTLFYDGGQHLKEISDSSGYAIILDYNSSSQVLDACAVNLTQSTVSPASTCSSISGPILKSSYGYTNGMLTSVTDPLMQVTNYEYSGNNIICVRPPGYSAACKISNTYDSVAGNTYQVVSQVLGTGETWSFHSTGAYAAARAYADDLGNLSGTRVTDPTGVAQSYSFSGMSPVYFTDANNHTTTYHFFGDQYHSANNGSGTFLGKVDFPEGNSLSQGFDSRMNVTSTTLTSKPAPDGSVSSIVTSSAYFLPSGQSPNIGFCNNLDPRNCNKPIWEKDGNGNQTDYTYDSNSGAVASIMAPAPSSGAARPLKLYTYVQLNASVRDSSGNLVTGSAMWLPGSETVCQTVAGSSSPVCDSNALRTVTTYEYGAQGAMNQLLLKGKVVSSGGVNLRTCFGYDWKGDKISETSARAGLAGCQ